MARIKKLTIGNTTYELGQVYNAVTATKDDLGLMSGEDKIALDKIKNLEIIALNEAEDGYASSYQLQDSDGNKLGATINIPKDQFLSSATITDKIGEGEDSNKKYLTLTFNIENGNQHSVDIPITDLINPAFGDGLEVDSETGKLKVKIDSESDNYLSLSESGLKISGIASEIGIAQEKDSDGNVITEATGLHKLIQDISDSVSSLQAASKTLVTGTNNYVTVSIDEEGQYKISGDTNLSNAISFIGDTKEFSETNLLDDSTTLREAIETLDSTLGDIWYNIDEDKEEIILNLPKKGDK